MTRYQVITVAPDPDLHQDQDNPDQELGRDRGPEQDQGLDPELDPGQDTEQDQDPGPGRTDLDPDRCLTTGQPKVGHGLHPSAPQTVRTGRTDQMMAFTPECQR